MRPFPVMMTVLALAATVATANVEPASPAPEMPRVRAVDLAPRVVQAPSGPVCVSIRIELPKPEMESPARAPGREKLSASRAP